MKKKIHKINTNKLRKLETVKKKNHDPSTTVAQQEHEGPKSGKTKIRCIKHVVLGQDRTAWRQRWRGGGDGYCGDGEHGIARHVRGATATDDGDD